MMSPEDSWVAKWQRISQYTFLYCVVFIHSESCIFQFGFVSIMAGILAHWIPDICLISPHCLPQCIY